MRSREGIRRSIRRSRERMRRTARRLIEGDVGKG